MVGVWPICLGLNPMSSVLHALLAHEAWLLYLTLFCGHKRKNSFFVCVLLLETGDRIPQVRVELRPDPGAAHWPRVKSLVI